MCWIRKVNILDMFDIASLGFLIGQGIGRWGNFVNQEAYGSFTGSSWWGMESDRTIAEMGEGLVHPCFLYESVWCIAGFFILNHLSKKRRFSGETALMYCVWYGFGRGIIELLRTDSLMLGNIKVSSLLSFILCVAGLTLLIVIRGRIKETAVAGNYEAVFEQNDDPAEDSESFLPEPEVAEQAAESTEASAAPSPDRSGSEQDIKETEKAEETEERKNEQTD